MNGSPEHLALRARIARGELAGPSMLVSTPLLAGEAQRWHHLLIRTAEDARNAARDAKAAGYDYLTISNGLTTEADAALVTASRTTGLPLDGHIPAAVGLAGVLAAGQTIEHMDKIAFAAAGHDPDTARVPVVRQAFAAHRVWVTPTSASLRALDIAGTPAYTSALTSPAMAYVDSATLGWWRSLAGQRERTAPSRFYTFELLLLKALHADGTDMQPGTDTSNPLMVAGFAVHDELDVLTRDAGFSNYEALRLATANVGRFLGDPAVGTLHVGSNADLLLVDGNPLRDLSVLRRPLGVLVRGQWLDRERLDALLRGARTVQ